MTMIVEDYGLRTMAGQRIPLEGVEVQGAETAAVSFPGFFDLLDSLRATTS